MEGNTSSRDPNTSFWQFSDELRLHTSAFSNLSLGNSIWTDSSSFAASNPKRPLPVADDRRNFDSSANPWKMTYSNQKLAFGAFNSYSNQVSRYNTDDNNNIGGGGGSTKNSADGNRNYFNSYYNKDNNYTYGGEIKNYFNKAVGKPVNSTTPGFTNNKNNSNNDVIVAGKKKKNVNNNSGGNNSSSNNNNNDVDKRFKTLPPAEALPRNEAIGGYIFVCNNETMPENLRRQLFGLPSRYRDSVRAIKPGLPLFLYNYSTHQLHGIFEAASFGGSNIDPTAWEDKKCPGESRFPAQVRVVTRKICDPLEEDAFRPILHHYDGPKFRLELNVEEALKLLDVFSENNA